MTIVVCGNEVLTAPNPFDVATEVLYESLNNFHEIDMNRYMAMFSLTHDITITDPLCTITWYSFFQDPLCTIPLNHPALSYGT